MPRVTHLGGATGTILFCLLWFIFSPNDSKYWAIEALIALGGSHGVVYLLKNGLPRIRPYLESKDLYTFPDALTDYSFPSGHTTAIFSIAVTFIYHEPMLACFFLPIASFVGYSRMYLALHYPTDVLAGVGLGSGFAYLVTLVVDQMLVF